MNFTKGKAIVKILYNCNFIIKVKEIIVFISNNKKKLNTVHSQGFTSRDVPPTRHATTLSLSQF